MHLPSAVDALAALAHHHRLAVFRLLVAADEDGVPAGAIASEIGVAASTLSTQLAILTRARLIRARRDGRSVIYAADQEGIAALLHFLVADCCGGRPELCRLLMVLPPACAASR